jgi:hypothetical protein
MGECRRAGRRPRAAQLTTILSRARSSRLTRMASKPQKRRRDPHGGIVVVVAVLGFANIDFAP